jgi:hypothetical protein
MGRNASLRFHGAVRASEDAKSHVLAGLRENQSLPGLSRTIPETPGSFQFTTNKN